MLQHGNDWLHEAEEETVGHEGQNLRLNAPIFQKKKDRPGIFGTHGQHTGSQLE